MAAAENKMEPIAGTLIHQENQLEATFVIRDHLTSHADMNNYSIIKSSPQYTLCGLTLFQIKADILNTKTSYTCQIFVIFSKLKQDDNLIYIIRFSSAALKAKENVMLCGTEINTIFWRQNISSNSIQHYFNLQFDVKVVMDLYQSPSRFEALYEDKELTDFELQAEDSSIHMHRLVLAATSPVLKTMLTRQWKETTEGRLKIAGTTKQTLENFKEFIYLQKTPDTGLEELLELGVYYAMPDLVQACSFKLLSTLTAENACNVMQLATKYKLTMLLFGIMKNIKMGLLQFHNIVESDTTGWI